jgi:hypothetical protein
MNLNQTSFPVEIPNAVSLNQITGVQYEPVAIARELVPGMREQISILHKTPDQILLRLNDALYKKDQVITLKKNDELFVSVLKAVDSNGLLITEDGIFKSGEVEWIVRG